MIVMIAIIVLVASTSDTPLNPGSRSVAPCALFVSCALLFARARNAVAPAFRGACRAEQAYP